MHNCADYLWEGTGDEAYVARGIVIITGIAVL